MENALEITSYNLTLILQVEEGARAVSVSGSVEDLAPILRDPLPVDIGGKEDNRRIFSSARDQLVLEFRPPQAILADVSGVWPARAVFADGADNLFSLLRRHSVSVSKYGWNVEGVLRNVDRTAVLGGLFDVPRVDTILGGDTEPLWTLPRIVLASSSTFSDHVVLSLADQSEEDEQELQFSINAHFDRSLGEASDLFVEAREFTSNAEGILSRLTGQE